LISSILIVLHYQEGVVDVDDVDVDPSVSIIPTTTMMKMIELVVMTARMPLLRQWLSCPHRLSPCRVQDDEVSLFPSSRNVFFPEQYDSAALVLRM
jgi:hypothetical protein